MMCGVKTRRKKAQGWEHHEMVTPWEQVGLSCWDPLRKEVGCVSELTHEQMGRQDISHRFVSLVEGPWSCPG